MESIAYISAVLASLLPDKSSAHNPSIVALAVLNLHRLNGMLNRLETAVEAGAPPVNVLDVRNSMHLAAREELRKLRSINLDVALFVNKSVPSGYPGSRLRLEVRATSWDASSPLYLTARDAK
ncbi:hypothetical protein AB4Y45_32295 [Paraburkholderia sp. EG287A]|uniref:hypothetical protein n=1 Tax=Paraburkholderia sp. EG287A TaxID=3237012 RepID=UPI0034D367F6